MAETGELRERFKNIFYLSFFLISYAELLFFIRLGKDLARWNQTFGVKQWMASLGLVMFGALAATLFSGVLAAAQTRWRRLDVSASPNGLGLCVFLSALAYFLHLFPGSLEPLMPPAPAPSPLPPWPSDSGPAPIFDFLGNLDYQAHVDTVRTRYQQGSILIAAISWSVLVAHAFLRRSSQIGRINISIIRNPIAVIGLSCLFMLSLLQDLTQ